VPLVLRIGYRSCHCRAPLTVQAAHYVAHTTPSKSRHGPSSAFQPSPGPAPSSPRADPAVCLVRWPCYSAAGLAEIWPLLHYLQLQLQVGSFLVPHGLCLCLRHLWHCRLQGIPRPHEGRQAGRRYGSGH
jgi:hypothetical protein